MSYALQATTSQGLEGLTPESLSSCTVTITLTFAIFVIAIILGGWVQGIRFTVSLGGTLKAHKIYELVPLWCTTRRECVKGPKVPPT